MTSAVTLDTEANKCFVCGPGNSQGLDVRFRLDGDVCRAEWTSTPEYMGYDGVTHGGILFCLLDDVMANILFLQGEVCVTAKAEVRYRHPLKIGETIDLEGRLQSRRGRMALIEGRIIRRKDEKLIADASGMFSVQHTKH